MKQGYSKKLRGIINDLIFLTLKESVYVVILTCVFIFLSFVVHVRTVPGEIVGFIEVYYGFPLEWFKMSANFGSWYSTLSRHEILWSGLVIDAITFVLLSIILVRVFVKFTDYISFTSVKRARKTHV